MSLIQPLPLPGSSGTRWFTGANATSFVLWIEDLFDFYKVPQSDQKSTLIRYCAWETKLKIKQMVEYQDPRATIESLYRALKLEYRDQDEFQQRYTIRKLNEIIRDGPSQSDEQVEGFIDMFHDISQELVSRGILSKYDQGVKFMQGLLLRLRNRVGRDIISTIWIQSL
jgi:hypothetical protein